MNARIIYASALICAVLFSPHHAIAQFALIKVADTNTAIPNGGGNFTGFTTLYGPAMSQGSVAFYATGSGGQKGYYVQTGGVLFRAADTNTIAPGGSKFIGFSPYAYGFEGDTLFFSGSAAGQNGIFLYSNAVIAKLVDSNTALPNKTNKFGGFLLLYPFDGRVAFLGQGANSGQLGIYRLEGGVVGKVADTNDNFIGGTGKLSFTSSSAELSHDAQGAVAFFCFDSTLSSRRAIFTAVGGTLSVVASTDTTVPGHAVKFTDFSRKPDLSGGKVVFVGTFSGGQGVYQANLDGSGLERLVESGTPIPGATANFTSFQNAAAELGTIVFTGLGSGVYGAYRLQNGALEKIVSKPDLLDGRTVEQVLLSNQGLSGGRLALQIIFSNGTAGIYSTVVGFANPSNPGGTLEPGSLLYSQSRGFSFVFSGEVGRAYRIQFNPNLSTSNWTTLSNFTYTAPITIVDSGATAGVTRVYRAISP